MTLSITAPGSANLKSNLDGGDHVVVHSEDTTQRAALLAALAALDPDEGLAAVVTALGGTLAISASALPLPAGAATQTTLAALLAKVIAAPATEAKQDAGNTALGLLATQSTLAAVLAKMIAAPATEAKQDTLKASVDALFNAIKPATGHAAVTPGTALATPSRALYIGGAGNISVKVGGVDATYAVTAGQTLNVVATDVNSAGTTATGIVSQF
jgi:hypothetical protein